ncbi:MAG: hypothetical protein RLZZ26_446 [Candidatus Parcubacteria bacterium]
MSSTRLPNKVLLPLADTTVLGHTVRQARRAKSIERVVVATSTEESDNAIEQYCREEGIDVFRGSLNDVLDRYYRAAQTYQVAHIARITSDCPFIDPAIIDRVADEYQKGDCDYASTGRIVSTFPDGMDTEIFSFTALATAWREARLPSEREHVTPYLWNHPETFKVIEVRNDRDLSAVRLTLDEPADYEVIKTIVRDVPQLDIESIIRYLETHPAVAHLNGSITRDEGYFKSLTEDEKQKN